MKLTRAYPQQGVSPCVHYYEPSAGTSNIPQERPLVWSTKIFPTWPAQCLQAAEVTLDTAGEKKICKDLTEESKCDTPRQE